MALRLLAVLIALLLAAYVPQLPRWRDYRWFSRWVDQLGDSSGPARVTLALLPPLALCLLVSILLCIATLAELLWLLFAIAVLAYSLGPRDLEADIDAVLKAPDRVRREAAAQQLRVHADDLSLPFTAPALVEATVLSALARRFGVIFWFLVLGPVGALGYRLAALLAGSGHGDDPTTRAAARRLVEVLDWLPAQLMVLAMALVSDFDAVTRTWREWHAAPGRSVWALESGFLGAVARAGVDADVAAGDGYSEDTSDPLEELADARRLILRVLVVWLAVAAVIALARWFA